MDWMRLAIILRDTKAAGTNDSAYQRMWNSGCDSALERVANKIADELGRGDPAFDRKAWFSACDAIDLGLAVSETMHCNNCGADFDFGERLMRADGSPACPDCASREVLPGDVKEAADVLTTGMRTVFELNALAFPIKLEASRDGFRTTYGYEIHENLDYHQAAANLGYSIMHALRCAGKIVEETDDAG